MKHEWIRFGEDRVNPFRRLRWCSLCGKVQVWESEERWGRVIGYVWYPRVGRCPGTGAKGKRPPKGHYRFED